MKKSSSIFAITWLLLLSFSTNTVAQTAPPFSDPAVNQPSKENTVWNLAIPPEWGSEIQNFRNANVAQNNRAGIAPVIYIQDAHCDYGAQKSIAALIEDLSQEYRAAHPAAEVLIVLEGAAGQLDIEPFRQFAATDAGRRVSDFYMRKGLLSGAEFAALNLGPHASLQGIEIPALYQQNRKSYREASEKEKDVGSLIRRLKARLEEEKQKIYSPGLLAVDQAENKFYAHGPHRMNLLEYADILIRSEKSINTGKEDFWQKRYPHLGRLEKIRRAERKINFQALEQEIGQMLSEIKARSHDSDSQGPTQWAEVKEAGDYAKFARRLLKNAAELAMALNNYPEIRRYQRYLRLSDEMEGPWIFEELDAWTEAVKTFLYRSPLEKAKDEETRLLRFAEKVTRLEATRSELEFVERMGRGGKISGELKALLEPALRFYADARRRDQALFKNFRSGLSASQKNRASKPLVFLVTGGFHSEALGTLFRKHDIPYRMLVPRFQRGEQKSLYTELMRGRISPLQKIAAAFDYDTAKALGQENRAKVRLEDGREVFYRFRFNANTLNAAAQKIDSVELVEAEFSPTPFTNKPEKSFPAQGRFGKLLNRKEKPFADRIKTIQTRKQKFLKDLSDGNRSIRELEEILSRLSKEKLALEPFFSKPPSRFEFVVAQFKAAAVGFSQIPPQPSAMASRVEPRMAAWTSRPWRMTGAASLGQPGRAAGGGLNKQALAGSLGTEPLHFEDPYAFQELVDTMREKFDIYFFQNERGGPLSEFEAESDFLKYVYAMVYVYSLEDVLEAFARIRMVLEEEEKFVREIVPNAVSILPPESNFLNAAGYAQKIKMLDEAAADVSIHTSKGRALKRFEAVDFKPELLDESRPEVYAEGVKRLVGLLRAYSEIAAQPNWAYRYNNEGRRSIFYPEISKDTQTDMIINLRTAEMAAERTLQSRWGSLEREGRAELFQMIENGHWAYLVVNRLIHEIPQTDFQKMRAVLEKLATDDARRLLSYIAIPPGPENTAAQGLSALKLEKLEAAYRDLYDGKIVEGFRVYSRTPDWATADGVFHPSTLSEIATVLSRAELKAGEKLLDLGSGDGRVVLTAAYLFGAEAHGYETDPELRELSEAMKTHLVSRPETKDEFDLSKAKIFADTFLSDDADWSQYDVIFYYDLGMDFQKEAGLAEKFKEKLKTMKPGARLIIHHNFSFDDNLLSFLEHIDSLQLTERSRATQIYRKPLHPTGSSLGTLDEEQEKALGLGINPALVAPGLRLDEKGEGYREPRSPDEEISREEKNRLREEKIRWWLDNHERGNKTTNQGVREMVRTGESRIRDEYRIYFVGKVPDEAEEDEGWYTAHQILHDVFLVSLTGEERREFFYLVKHTYEAYSRFTLNPPGRWDPSLLYFLVDEKILDDSKDKHPLQTYNGLIRMSETFARLAGHYLGLPYPPDSVDGKDHYDFHESIFHPFFDKIGLRAAASLGASGESAIQRWAFMGKGGAMSEAASVEKTVLDPSILDPSLAELEKKIRAMGNKKQNQKSVAEMTLAHLKELAASGKIFGFDELRWAEDDYLVAFMSPEEIALGRGFFDPGAFSAEQLAELLLHAGLKKLALAQGMEFQPFEEETAVEVLEKAVFPKSQLWPRVREFTDLSAPFFLNAAMDRFNGFEQGSPHFGTINLFEQWMEADMKGTDLHVFKQAAYLKKVFLQTPLGQKILDGTYAEAEDVPAQDRDFVLKSYVKVLIPVFAFAIFRDEFLSSVKNIRNKLVRGAEADARKHRIPLENVDIQGAIAAYIRRESIYNPFVALATNLSGTFENGSFTLEDLERHTQKFNHLGILAISNKSWLDRQLEEIRKHTESDTPLENIEVPGAGWTSIDHVAAQFAFLAHQTWKGWSHVVNYGRDGIRGFGLQLAKDVQQNDVVRVVTLDGVPKGGMSTPPSFLLQSYRYKADALIIQRLRQAAVWDLLQWHQKNFQNVLTKDENFFPFLSALLNTRKNITEPTVDLKLPQTRYSIQGVDPVLWANSILKFANMNDLVFWPMVKSYYGSLRTFADVGAEDRTDDDDITLFWYYSMFTSPRGIFAWLAGKHPEHREPLRYVGNSSKLTDESARNLLDALMGIFWSSPSGGDDLAHRKGPLLARFLDFVRLTPNGVFISDPAAFEKFLTQDLADKVMNQPSMAHFEEWRAKRFPEDIPEDQKIGHVILTKEPQRGEAEVLSMDQPSYYYPLMIQPEHLLFPEKWPWKNTHEPTLAVYVAEYQDGIVVPAPQDKIAFKYVIQGIANGTPLRVTVFPDGNVLIQKAYQKAEDAAPAYVTIPLAKAQGGFIPPQKTWQRIPAVDPALHPERFYQAEVAKDGLVVLRLGERVVSLTAPGLSGRHLLVEIHQGGLLLYDTEAPAYVAKVSFNAKVMIEPNSAGLSLLPELPESVRDNHFQTVKEHAALRILADRLKDTMKLGIGYKKIAISDEPEIRLEKDKIFLPRSYLDAPENAAADVEKHLSSNDLLRKLEEHVAGLRKLDNSSDIFGEKILIPDNPPPVFSETLDTWPVAAREIYKKLIKEMNTVHKRLGIMRNIGRYRQQLGTMASPDRLRKSLAPVLRRDPQDFMFVSRGGDTFHGLKGIQGHEGAGYITEQFYNLDPDHDLVLEERYRSSAEAAAPSRQLIFVRFRKDGKEDGKLVLLLFDAETGQLFDEDKNQLTRQLEILYQAVPLLAGEPGLKDELHKALSRVENTTQQIQILNNFQQFLPKLLASASPRVNTAMVRLVLASVAQGGFAQGRRLHEQFSAGNPALRMPELEFLLLFFDLDPGEDKNQKDPGYPQRFEDFVNGVLIPMVQSSWKGAPDFSEPSYFEQLTDYLTGIRHQVQALWDLGSIRVEGSAYKWDGQMAQRFGLVSREIDEPNSIHQYFMKLGPGMETPVEVETEAVTPEERRMSRAERRQRATHLTFLGGVEGIGGSSMEVAYQGMETPDWARILVDAGAHLDDFNTPPAYRYLKDIPNAVFLTHSHIDHIGSAVFLYRRLGKAVPFYATRDTVDLLRITLHAMVRDSQRTAEEYNYVPRTFFTEAEVEEFLKHIIAVDPVEYDEDGAPVYPVLAVSPKMKVQFHHAGHLHGAASLIVMTPDGNTFISGDLSMRAQGPVKGFRKWNVGMPPIHTAVTESTYGMALRESEEEQEEQLIQNIIKVLKRGGKVLLPAYANGRSPRLLDVILRKKDQFPPEIWRKLKIFVDGMAEAFTAAHQRAYPELRDNHIELIGNKFATPREGYEYREEHVLARRGPTIIIASSANLQGMSAWYAKKLAGDPRNGIFFTGYMDPLEPASAIMDVKDGETFVFKAGEDPVMVRAERGSFKLSGHAAGHEILEILQALAHAGNVGAGLLIARLLNVFYESGLLFPNILEFLSQEMFKKIEEGSMRRVIFVHGNPRARAEMIKAVKTLKRHEEWHPIDTRAGEMVLSVVEPENKFLFESVSAIPLSQYKAASLGVEKADSIYRLLGKERVQNLSPHFVKSFLDIVGELPKIGGSPHGLAGLYRKAQSRIEKFGIFFIHGNLVLDEKTGKAILLAGNRHLGKSVVTAGLIRDSSRRFEFISDSGVLALVHEGRLYAGPAAYFNPESNILPPSYRNKEERHIPYAKPSRPYYRFFLVEGIVHLTQSGRTTFSKTTEGIEADQLSRTLADQIAEFTTPPDRATEVAHFVEQNTVFGITVDIPADKERRDYAGVVADIKEIVGRQGGASLGDGDLQAKLNELFGIPENEPWNFTGASRSYAVHSTPFYYRVGDLFYLPYLDAEFGSRLAGKISGREYHYGWRHYLDQIAYRNLLDELVPFRDNWIVARLRFGLLTPFLDFSAGYFNLSAILGLMETKDLYAGRRMLDAGSGGGILTVTASRLGAGYAFGIDNDKDLIQMAEELRRLNGLDSRLADFSQINFEQAAEQTAGGGLGRFDYIAANLEDWGLFVNEKDAASAGGEVPVYNWNGLLLERFPGAQYYLAAGGRIDRNLSDWTETILKEHFRHVDMPVRIPGTRGDYGVFLGRERKTRAQSLGIVPFEINFERWKWRLGGAGLAIKPNEVREAIRDLLSQKDFMEGTLQRLTGSYFASTPAWNDVAKINIRHLQEGRLADGEGIFRAEVILKDGKRGFFVLVIPKIPNHSPAVEQIFENLRTLHALEPKYIGEPFMIGRGRYLDTEWDDEKTGEIAIFSMRYLPRFQELNSRSDGELIINPHPQAPIKLGASQASMLRREMVKILTLYYEKSGHRMIRGLSLEAGDFMKQIDSLNLQLITVRTLRENSISGFIQALVNHKEGTAHRYKVFAPEEVYGGIRDALVEIYGGDRGNPMADQWLGDHRQSAMRGASLGKEIPASGLLDGLRAISGAVEQALQQVVPDKPVILMITGKSATFKTQLAKLLRAGIAGFSPEEIDSIGTDDLTEGKLNQMEMLRYLTAQDETKLFKEFLARKREDGKPFRLKIVEGYHAPDFFERVGVKPHVDVAVSSPDKMRILIDFLRYGYLGPLLIFNYYYMRDKEPLAEFPGYPGPEHSRILFHNDVLWSKARWNLSRQYNQGKSRFDSETVARTAAQEKLPAGLLGRLLEPNWSDKFLWMIYNYRVKREGAVKLPSMNAESLGQPNQAAVGGLGVQALAGGLGRMVAPDRNVESKMKAKKIVAASLGHIIPLFDLERKAAISRADIAKSAADLDQALRVLGLQAVKDEIERQTVLYIGKIRREHQAVSGFYAALPDRNAAKVFLKRALPLEAHLAVIFAASDAAAPYSLESLSYRDAIRTVLESNPLAFIRIAHTGSSPKQVKEFQHEFAAFGSRIRIESAEREHFPYVLNGFLNDELLNQVKSLSGRKGLKQTELIQFISVVAEEEVLNQFRKIALGGKELVSLVHSKILNGKDAALIEGAMLFEWGMAHFVAFHQADEIRREISEEELSIRGNRFIPNEAGLAQFLTSLGEAWQGIQMALKAA